MLADRAAAVLLIATVTFNALLALVNGNLFTLNGNMVALVQATLTCAAIAVALIVKPDGIARWIAFAWMMMILALVIGLLSGAPNPKTMGDMLLIPAFAALGLCIRRDTLIRTLIGLQVALVIFAAWELFAPTSFGDVFKIRNYYVATRGFSEDVFWAGSDNLFLSAQRPTGRLLSFGMNLNRASSLFLEPVSLGNWTIVVAIATATFWKQISRRDKTWLLVTNVLLLYACDGRLAMAVVALILLSLPIMRFIPRLVPVFYLPIMVVLLSGAAALGYVDRSAGDTLTGRYAYGIDYLTSIDLPRLFALVPSGESAAADSGWAHVIYTQSIFGLIALWLALTLLGPSSETMRRFTHSAALYMALAVPVSFSILSIKVAATLWMILGAVSAQEFARRAAAREEEAGIHAGPRLKRVGPVRPRPA